jgi:hypothetical protein
MTGGFWHGAKRFIWWDYPRASWQYDVMVALILAFIFLTPRDFFRDQPRPKSIAMLPAEHGTSQFWLEAGLLNPVAPAERMAAAEKLVRSQPDGRNRTLIRLEPIFNDEKEIQGFLAFTRP